MKNILLLVIIIGAFLFNDSKAQGIGEIAPEKPPMVLPNNALGLDLIFGEGGFGLGGFYRRQLSTKFTIFTDISISEAKDDREFEYIDYFGNIVTIGKKNRVFLIPLNFGMHVRLFENSLADNLRPYIGAAVGPTLILTTPYAEEFFNSFGYAQTKYGGGGYFVFGANFGSSSSNLLGINIRYYYLKVFGDGVESLAGNPRDHLQGFYVTLYIGTMY